MTNLPVWLNRPPEAKDFVQLISTRRMYTVKRILPGGKLRLCLRHWPVLEVCPERVRVWNPALSVGIEENMTEKTYLTPLGNRITYDEVVAQGRVICPVCDGAVIEDELTACLECKENLCIYCWEGYACPCPCEKERK